MRKPGYRLFLFFLAFSQNAICQDNRVTDSLEKIVTSKSPDTIKVVAYSNLCWEYRNTDQVKAKKAGLNAVKLSRKIKYKKGLSMSLNDLSIIYMDQTKLDTALILLKQTLAIRTELKDSIGIGAVHNKIAIVYQTKLELKKALEHNLLALDIFEKKNIVPYISQCLNNIGVIHFNLKNYPKALEFYQKCIDIRKKLGDKGGLAASYVNNGNVYIAMSDTLKAIENIKLAITIFKEINNERDLSYADHNLGGIYNMRKQYKKALPYIEEALVLRTKLSDNRGVAATLILSGEAYTGLNVFTTARNELKKALKISIDNKLPDEEKFSYQKLAILYTKRGMADSVFYYYSMYEGMSNDFYQKNINDKVLDLQEKYDAVAREKKLLKSENERQTAIIASQKLFRWVYILLICILAVSGYFIVKAQYNKRLAQKKLNEATLAEKEAGLKAVINATEEERKRIAKDLHDGVGQQMTGLKMAWQQLSSNIKTLSTEEKGAITNITKILDDTSTEVRSISHQMMPKVLTEMGLVPAIDDMLKKSLGNTSIQYTFDHVLFRERYDERIEISLFRVCQELINNIIKHSGGKKASVQLIDSKNFLMLIVEDDGKGMSANKTDGIGLMNIKSRVNVIHGDINYESGENAGTVATIRVPL